jgi:aryl-alcohol dehydrogenase-like predicted oxidoreductase
MAKNHFNSQNRRQFIQTSFTAAVGLTMTPYLVRSGNVVLPETPAKRRFGKIDFMVTTLGLGGQASIQWTPSGIDPVAIILKAHKLGINYYDTSNYYGPSQLNYGKAFRQLGLVPGQQNYSEAKRKAIFVTSKTGLRFGKGGDDRPDVQGGTNGPKGSKAIDDVHRTLTQVFGDGNGNYPEGAYLDMVLIHTLNNLGEVDALYEGYNHPDPNAVSIGALAALRDVRDGTNRTGLNPKNEKLIRHIGFSGHKDAAVMIEMIQRDSENLIDGMLVAINANDKQFFNMQHNVIPVAAAKNIGIIAMKVFADGAMYTKKAEWSNTPEHVVLQVSSPELPAHHLIRYSLTTPGIHTAIIGIGQISDDPQKCQLTQNMIGAQVKPNEMSEEDRKMVEVLASKSKGGKTNYFQNPYQDLTAPGEVKVKVEKEEKALITWHTAYAGDAAIDHYEVWRNGAKVANVPFTPQTSKIPHLFTDNFGKIPPKQYVVKAVDKKNRVAGTGPIAV